MLLGRIYDMLYQQELKHTVTSWNQLRESKVYSKLHRCKIVTDKQKHENIDRNI